MNGCIKKVVLVCIVFYAHSCLASLSALLPELNTALNNLSISLPNAQEGSFIQGLFNFAPFVELLEDRDFQKAIGLNYYEAQDLFMYHTYYCHVHMAKIIEKDSKKWDIIKDNWNLLKEFFPASVQLTSFEITDEGLMGHMQFFKDRNGTQSFSLDDCKVIVNELQKLDVVVTCLITPNMPIKILGSKNKEIMLANKDKIIKILDESLQGKNNFVMMYEILLLRLQKNVLKRVGGVDLIARPKK